MKLLFDHNISPDLVQRLRDLFPGSAHVFHLDLHELADVRLWRYAREHGFTIVSKDADFAEISMLHGFPPKLIWLRLGNCRTEEIEETIRASVAFIHEMDGAADRGILSLFRKSTA